MSHRIRSACFAIVLLFLARSAMAQQFVEELTLADAVKLALEDNRQIEIARLEVRKFDDRLGVAKTHRLPKFEFGALAAELIRKVNFDFKKGDLGTITGLGPVPETDVTATAPRRLGVFVNGSV